MAVNNIVRPIILKKMILKADGLSNMIPIQTNNGKINNKYIKIATIPLIREDVIFESKNEPFLPGEYHSITIINKYNNLTNNCETIARCVTRNDEVVLKTSENLIRLIGQEAYNIVFHALCSIISQEYKVKGILSLLTVLKDQLSIQTLPSSPVKLKIKAEDKSCQTDETRLSSKKKVRRRIRKVLVPYVVQPEENKKKFVVHPFPSAATTETQTEQLNAKSSEEVQIKSEDNFKKDRENNSSNFDCGKSLPDLGYLQDDSNDSLKSASTINTLKTSTELLSDPMSIVENVDRHTKYSKFPIPHHPMMLMDGTEILLQFKPEDAFHIATKENLQHLDKESRKKLLLHQMFIDYKHCCTLRDEDENLPIHLAVLHDDLELLKRQCVVLKIRNQSVDIPAAGGMTALKLSIFRESADATNVLLQHGADPFLADEEHNTCVHQAAELKTDHLDIILHHCKMNARNIISQHAEELQKAGWQEKSDEELSTVLLRHICCTLFDKQGYNPLMLACKIGNYQNVRLLLDAVPASVNVGMPNSGNTPLYLTIAAACTVAAERGNKSKIVDHFRQTIEQLLQSGADPFIENSAGCNVNTLLQEVSCSELTMLVANKLPWTRYLREEMDHTKTFENYYLTKKGNDMTISELNTKSESRSLLKKFRKAPSTKSGACKDGKPKIIEDVLIKTAKDGEVATSKVNHPMKIEIVSSVKKIIWCPVKRKAEEEDVSTKKKK